MILIDHTILCIGWASMHHILLNDLISYIIKLNIAMSFITANIKYVV